MKLERDRLTGLYNKEKAMELIRECLNNTEEEGVAIVIDIDNFQRINNLFGVESGDLILQDTANILREFFQEEDIISRTSGDQFIVFLRNCADDINLNIRLHELCASLEQEVSGREHLCKISASIGVALTREQGRKIDDLYYAASMAMDEVKKNGKGSVNFYHDHKIS